MLYWEIIAVCSEIDTKEHKYTVRAERRIAEVIACSDQCADTSYSYLKRFAIGQTIKTMINVRPYQCDLYRQPSDTKVTAVHC